VIEIRSIDLHTVLAMVPRNPQFWLTADQRGDLLLRAGKFSEAAKTYTSPERIGAAGICDEVSISLVKPPARSDTAKARPQTQMKAVRC